MDKVRIGVVGIGKMGRFHVQAYSSLKHICELVGLYDIEQQRSEQAASEYGTRAFTSLDSLLREVDAVTIATPTSRHSEVAMAAIKNGVHILVEKPITNHLAEAQSIMQAAIKKGLILQVGHIERFNPAIQELPNVLEGQDIIAISGERLSPYDPRIDDTDVIQDLMIHDIDIVRALGASPISSIKASGRRINSHDLIDYAVTLISFENGIIATLTASRVTEKTVRKLQISTTSSFVELDYFNRKLTVSRRKAPANELAVPSYDEDRSIEKVFIPQEDALTAQLKHFLSCVSHDTKPLIDGRDGLEALRLTKEIQNKIYTIAEDSSELAY